MARILCTAFQFTLPEIAFLVLMVRIVSYELLTSFFLVHVLGHVC